MTDREQRRYRSELGWTSADLVETRHRWARMGGTAAVGLVVAALGETAGRLSTGASSTISVLPAFTIVTWLGKDRRFHHGGTR